MKAAALAVALLLMVLTPAVMAPGTGAGRAVPSLVSDRVAFWTS